MGTRNATAFERIAGNHRGICRHVKHFAVLRLVVCHLARIVGHNYAVPASLTHRTLLPSDVAGRACGTSHREQDGRCGEILGG